MRPVRIIGADAAPLGAPPDWDAETSGSCGALFVRREKIEGVAYMRSAWEVEDNEAAMLYAGARITIGISGTCHPVVQFGLIDPPEDFDPVVNARRITSPSGISYARVEMLFPFEGVKRVYIDVPITKDLASAVAFGVDQCEKLARERGWIT